LTEFEVEVETGVINGTDPRSIMADQVVPIWPSIVDGQAHKLTRGGY
jgi:hypothetical protein